MVEECEDIPLISFLSEMRKTPLSRPCPELRMHAHGKSTTYNTYVGPAMHLGGKGGNLAQQRAVRVNPDCLSSVLMCALDKLRPVRLARPQQSSMIMSS